MAANDRYTVAVIQAAPAFLDRAASAEKACGLIAAAAETGAVLAAFGECWLPGYPIHAWVAPSSPLWWECAADYIDQAVEIPSPTTEALCEAARTAGIDVVIGIAERDRRTRGSVYATLLFIGRDGDILGRHRKLKPTLYERVAWADGDSRGLIVHERPYARISGLNCWEHQMRVPGYSLMQQGTQIHIAAWPGREPAAPPAPIAMWPRQTLLSRAFASQGACYVLCAAGMLTPEAIPEKYRELFSRPYTGDSVIIDPRGEIVAGPAEGETILTAEIDLALVRAAKVAGDVAGHYARPDIFDLRVAGAANAEETSGQAPVEAREPDDSAGDDTAGAERPDSAGDG